MIKRFLNKWYRLNVAALQILYKRVGYILFATLAVYFITLTVQASYYRFMPGTWFVHITEKPFINNAKVTDPLLLKFCRETRYNNISAVGARTYYAIVDQGQVSAGHYDFQARIEKRKDCQFIRIPANKHPTRAGNYTTHTDLTFYVEGHKKTISYDTNQFALSDTKETLDQQIKDLQLQIEDLRAKLGVNVTPTQAQSDATSVAFPTQQTEDQRQQAQTQADNQAIQDAADTQQQQDDQGSRFDRLPVVGGVFKFLGL